MRRTRKFVGNYSMEFFYIKVEIQHKTHNFTWRGITTNNIPE